MTSPTGIDDQTAPLPPAPSSVGFFRQVTESMVVLTIAVLAFRMFVAEGYLISTGSMAPSLLGYHKQVECPACHFQFASGVLVDEDEVASTSGSAQAQDLQGDLEPPAESICPNCGQRHIDLASLPRNEGDQLMVHKHAYEFRDPRRWEVIVFKNPSDPLQAYVKRVVGLPGEVVAIRDGDIYIDDRLQPRSLEAQRGMAILVDDHDHEPTDDPQWQPRWIVNRPDSGWHTNGPAFLIDSPASDIAPAESQPDASRNPLPDLDWLTFRHWIRSGGRHVTTTPLSNWPRSEGFAPAVGLIKFDFDLRQLSAVGVVENDEVAMWEDRSTDATFLRALRQLAASSHEAPIVDEYGYNRSSDGDSTFIVRDLLASFDLRSKSGKGLAAVSIDDGHDRYTVYLDFARGVAGVREEGQDQDVREAVLTHAGTGKMTVEVSLMDRQLLVAINGEQLFEPVLRTDQHAHEPPAPRRPIAIGVAGGAFEVTALKVFRDVYYTPKSDANLVRRLKEDEFYVLGDNSPVSVDSRCWEDPAVKRRDLVGKPVVVHLPSQQGKISLFGETKFVRIPDFSRVRYIH